MKFAHILILCAFNLIIQANSKTEQRLPNINNPEIDKLWNKHAEQSTEQQDKLHSSANFTPEFAKILLAAAPEALKQKLLILQNPNCPTDKKPRLLLLYGPSGSGKTTLAELLAQQTQRQYVRINAANLGTELVNSHQSNFKKAIEPYLNAPCVIAIDEMDALIKEASSPNDPEKKVPQQIWSLLDELAKNPHVLVIGTTNDISNLPNQFKTRFSDSMIEVPNVKPEIKKEIFLYYIKRYSHDCDENFLITLANNCNDLSIREIEKVVSMAWSKAFIKNPSSVRISKKDMEDAVADLRKIVTAMKKADESKNRNKNLERFREGGWYAAGATIATVLSCAIAEGLGYPCPGRK